MNVITKRLIRILYRAGLLKHPFGPEYVRENYTWTGRTHDD